MGEQERDRKTEGDRATRWLPSARPRPLPRARAGQAAQCPANRAAPTLHASHPLPSCQVLGTEPCGCLRDYARQGAPRHTHGGDGAGGDETSQSPGVQGGRPRILCREGCGGLGGRRQRGWGDGAWLRAFWEAGTTTRKRKGPQVEFHWAPSGTGGLGYLVLCDPHSSAVRRPCPHSTDMKLRPRDHRPQSRDSCSVSSASNSKFRILSAAHKFPISQDDKEQYWRP